MYCKMVYEINNQKLREGLEELMKLRVNEILDDGGPFHISKCF